MVEKKKLDEGLTSHLNWNYTFLRKIGEFPYHLIYLQPQIQKS